MTAVVLVHGAGSGPWIFDDWLPYFDGMELALPDLHEGLAIERASMDDYASKVVEACAVPQPTVVCGWSMGGLVAAMTTQRCDVEALVLIEPSPPSEVQGENPNVEVTDGAFDAAEVYGAFPPGIPARSESQRARDERKRGIPVPSLPRTLCVYGDEFRQERGEAIVSHYRCESLYFPGLDHWGLILDERVPAAVAEWIKTAPLAASRRRLT